MATRTTISLKTRGLREFASWMDEMEKDAFGRSQRSAVTFLAKDYAAFKTGRIASDIDRPTAFTRRAYDWDGARRTGEILARAFVRERQSRYLEILETGGTRRTVGRRGPMAIKREVANQFGSLGGRNAIRNRFLNRSSLPSGRTLTGRPIYRPGDRRYVIQRLRIGGESVRGLFEQTKLGSQLAGNAGWKTRLLIRFLRSARYEPQLNFRRDAGTYARSRFPAMSLRLFNEELARARRT